MASTRYAVPIPIPSEGVHPELTPSEIGPRGLVDAENWVFRDGRFKVRPGLVKFGQDIAQRPMGLIQYPHTSGNPKIVLGTTDGWWVFDESTKLWVDISGTALSGSPSEQQVFRVFIRGGTSYLLGVNGADTMKVWDGSAGTYTEVGGSPPKARTMMALFSRVMLGNLLSGGDASPIAIDVSGFEDFDTGWGSVQVENLSDTPGEIVAMAELGDLQGAIYKSDAIVIAYAQADLNPFRFEWRVVGIKGPASPLSVVQVTEGLHIYLGSDGAVMQFDGSSTPKSLGRNIQRYVLQTADLNYLNRAFGFYDAERREVVFVYTENGSTDNNRFIVVNPDSGQLWPGRWPGGSPMSAGRKIPVTTTGLTIGELSGGISDQTKTIAEYEKTATRSLYVTGRQAAIGVSLGTGDGTTYRFRVPWPFPFNPVTGAFFGLNHTAAGIAAVKVDGVSVAIAGPATSGHCYLDSDGFIVFALILHPGVFSTEEPPAPAAVLTIDFSGRGQAFEDRGNDDDGETIKHFFETGLTDLAESNPAMATRWKTVHELDHQIPSIAQRAFSIADVAAGRFRATALNVQLGVSDYGDEVELSDAQALDASPGSGRHVTGHRVTGRSFSVRVSGESIEETEYQGASAAVSIRGAR